MALAVRTTGPKEGHRAQQDLTSQIVRHQTAGLMEIAKRIRGKL